MSIILYIKVSESEGLICDTLYGYVFVFARIIVKVVFWESSIKGLTLQHSVGVESVR